MPILYYIICINLLSYYLMWKDKRAAKRLTWRIPEKNLFLLALIGASAGIYLGTQYPLYHKSSKWAFRTGIPIIFILQIILVSIFFYPCV